MGEGGGRTDRQTEKLRAKHERVVCASVSVRLFAPPFSVSLFCLRCLQQFPLFCFLLRLWGESLPFLC